MKSFPSLFLHFVRNRASRRNLRTLAQFFLLLVSMVALYSVGFHFLMAWEGKEYSWITGVYWTLTVMSTLGFGDITFHTDLGRIFSIMVLPIFESSAQLGIKPQCKGTISRFDKSGKIRAAATFCVGAIL